MEFTAGELLDLREATYAAAKLERVRAEVTAWRDEWKAEADKSYEHARPYILAEIRMKCYQAVIDLLDGES